MRTVLIRLATFGLYGGRRRGPRELKRTCDRCGNVWYISPAEAKMRAPNGMQMAGMKMQSAGNRSKVIGGKKKAMVVEQRIARAERQSDRVAEINRCSSCGSTSFTEETV